MKNPFVINIRIGKMKFPITIEREEEETYRAAEKHINDRLNFYAGKYQHLENEAYMAMTILDIAVALKQKENINDTKPFMNTINDLLEEMETCDFSK